MQGVDQDIWIHSRSHWNSQGKEGRDGQTSRTKSNKSQKVCLRETQLLQKKGAIYLCFHQGAMQWDEQHPRWDPHSQQSLECTAFLWHPPNKCKVNGWSESKVKGSLWKPMTWLKHRAVNNEQVLTCTTHCGEHFTSHALTHLSLPTTLWAEHYICSHFIDKGTEAQSIWTRHKRIICSLPYCKSVDFLLLLN